MGLFVPMVSSAQRFAPEPTFMADPIPTSPAADCLDARAEGELLRGNALREEAALEAFFQRFGGRVFAYVRTLGGRGFPAIGSRKSS